MENFKVGVMTGKGSFYGKSISNGVNSVDVFLDLDEKRFKGDFYKYLNINQGE
jgi:hypothetical protein